MHYSRSLCFSREDETARLYLAIKWKPNPAISRTSSAYFCLLLEETGAKDGGVLRGDGSQHEGPFQNLQPGFHGATTLGKKGITPPSQIKTAQAPSVFCM